MSTPQRFFLYFIDIICILVALGMSSHLMLPPHLAIFADYTGASTFTLIIFFLTFYIFNCYNLGREDFKDSIIRVLVAVSIGIIGTGFLFYTFENWRFPRLMFVLQMAITLALCLGWRVVFIKLTRLPSPTTEHFIFLGSNMASRAYHVLNTHLKGAAIVGYVGKEDPKLQKEIPWLGEAVSIQELVIKHSITGVLVLDSKYLSENIAHTLLESKLQGLMVEDMRSLYERLAKRIPVDLINDGWLLLADGFNLKNTTFMHRTKRAFDVAFALFLLIITAPLLLLIIILVKFESSGNIFYAQQRIGLRGKIFTLYKIRSMHHDAEKNGAVWAQAHDERITKIGHFMRKTRIDELPQLINVLKGEMSIVGPRPERPSFTEQLEKQLPYYQLRHCVKPGITGWAQVCYPYGASLDDSLHKLEYDLYYIKHFSLILEIKIILKTIGVVLFPKGVH